MCAHLHATTNLPCTHLNKGFSDSNYRSRRADLARLAQEHVWDEEIATIKYTTNEIETWTSVWDRMEKLWEQYACKEYLVRLYLTFVQC